MTRVPLAVGCDVGGSSCKLRLVDPSGRVLERVRFACAAPARADHFLLPLYDAIDGLTGGRAVCGLGVLLPGYLDDRRSVPRLLINLRALEGVPLRGLLEERDRTRVELDIDRNGHALAEYWHGDPRKAQRLLHVAIGTGVGVGLVVDARICRLTNHSVGELGHRIVIGGGLSGAAEFFLPAAGRWLNAHWFDRDGMRIVLQKTALGADAGVMGAATLVLPRSDRGGSNDRRRRKRAIAD